MPRRWPFGAWSGHPAGAGGLIRFQVRNGLGAMPAFKEDRLSAQQLDDLIAYLDAIRAHPPTIY